MVFIAFDHRPVVEQCKGCAKVCHDWCVAYTHPEEKWKNGRCNLCTVKEVDRRTGQRTKKINPLKESKGYGRKPYVGKKGKYERSWEDRATGGQKK